MGNFPVSVCMVVKNAGKHLEKALESIEEIASEIIIVEINPPGSFTNSLRFDYAQSTKGGIVEENGIIKVFEYQWDNDYSAARNYSLERATQPWILVMDEDNIFDPLNRDELGKSLSRSDVSLFYLKSISIPFIKDQINQAILMPIERKDYEEFQPFLTKGNEVQISKKDILEIGDITLKGALFKNKTGIRYQGKVFESLTNINNLKSETADIYIYRFNYSEHFNAKEQQTNIKLLDITLKNDFAEDGIKGSLLTEKLFYHSKLLTLKLNSDPAIKGQIIELNNMLNANRAEPSKFHSWYYESTAFLLNKNELGLCLDILRRVLDIYPESIALLFNFYQLLFKVGKIYECTQILKYMIYLNKTAMVLNPDILFPARLLSEDYLKQQLTLCYDELGDYSSSSNFIKEL